MVSAAGLSYELDVAYRLQDGVAARFKDKIKTAPKIGTSILGMVVSNPLLTDKRVREAIVYAFDRGRLVGEISS